MSRQNDRNGDLFHEDYENDTPGISFTGEPPEDEAQYDVEAILREFSAEEPEEPDDEPDILTALPKTASKPLKSGKRESARPERGEPPRTLFGGRIPRQWLYLIASGCVLLAAIVMCIGLIVRSGEVKDLTIPSSASMTTPTETPTAPSAPTQPTATDPTDPTPAPSDDPGLSITPVAPRSVNGSTRLNYLLLTLDAQEELSGILLWNIDTQNAAAQLLTVPLDSYISGEGGVARLSYAFTRAGGGSNGAAALRREVEKMIGFTVEDTIVLSQQTLRALVDRLGGVQVTLPGVPGYTDRIFPAGLQTLDGDTFAALFRFRSSYSEVQAEAYAATQQAAMRVLLAGILQQPDTQKRDTLLYQMKSLADTALTEENLAYFAQLLEGAALAQMRSATLTGSVISDGGRSYYALNAQTALSILNNGFNPLTQPLKAESLAIRVPQQEPTAPPTTEPEPTEPEPTEPEPTEPEPTEPEPTEPEPTEPEPTEPEPTEPEPTEPEPTEPEPTEPSEEPTE